MGERGVGIGGLANTREDYTTSRYNHYAPYVFEEEITDTDNYYYYPQNIGEYNGQIPIVFNIGSEKDLWTKLRTIKLEGEFIVKNKTTGTAPLLAEKWSLINNFVHSFFSKVSVKINDHEIVDR